MSSHIVELTETGWTLMHPLACRPNLFACPVNQAAKQLDDTPAAGIGRYLCGVDKRGRFAVGERTEQAATPTDLVLAEVARERERQDAKWGEQNHPDGTGENRRVEVEMAKVSRRLCQMAAKAGMVTWRMILDEEMREAFAATDPAELRAELVQVAAVATAWAEAIDRRTQPLGAEPSHSPAPTETRTVPSARQELLSALAEDIERKATGGEAGDG